MGTIMTSGAQHESETGVFLQSKSRQNEIITNQGGIL